MICYKYYNIVNTVKLLFLRANKIIEIRLSLLHPSVPIFYIINDFYGIRFTNRFPDCFVSLWNAFSTICKRNKQQNKWNTFELFVNIYFFLIKYTFLNIIIFLSFYIYADGKFILYTILVSVLYIYIYDYRKSYCRNVHVSPGKSFCKIVLNDQLLISVSTCTRK